MLSLELPKKRNFTRELIQFYTFYNVNFILPTYGFYLLTYAVGVYSENSIGKTATRYTFLYNHDIKRLLFTRIAPLLSFKLKGLGISPTLTPFVNQEWPNSNGSASSGSYMQNALPISIYESNVALKNTQDYLDS
jgi:hypothetical protein